MTQAQRRAASYGEVMVETGVQSADRVELVQMLLDGLVESLSFAEGHIRANAISEKAYYLKRASSIVIGLQGALDFKKGGELAQNLAELYGYVTRRLLHVNLRNDLAALHEVKGLMEQIRDAWRQVPALVPVAQRSL